MQAAEEEVELSDEAVALSPEAIQKTLGMVSPRLPFFLFSQERSLVGTPGNHRKTHESASSAPRVALFHFFQAGLRASPQWHIPAGSKRPATSSV